MILWSRVLKQLNQTITDHEDFKSLNDCFTFLYDTCGLSIRQIAKLCNCSKLAVRQRMLRGGLQLRSRGGPNNVVEVDLDSEDFGLSPDEISCKYGVCRNTARNIKNQF